MGAVILDWMVAIDQQVMTSRQVAEVEVVIDVDVPERGAIDDFRLRGEGAEPALISCTIARASRVSRIRC